MIEETLNTIISFFSAHSKFIVGAIVNLILIYAFCKIADAFNNKLEKQLLDQLIGLGYKSIVVNDEAQLEKNFRTQLYLHNQSKMKSKPFTDAEFERVKIFLDGKSVFQSAKLLRDKMPLVRDDGTEINLEFFNSKMIQVRLFGVENKTFF